MAVSTLASERAAQLNCSNIMLIPRRRSLKLRYFSGPGSNKPSSEGSYLVTPTSSTRFMSALSTHGPGWPPVIMFTGITENAEDVGTLIYLEDVAQQAGVETTLLGIEEIGLRDDGSLVDCNTHSIEVAFKLYPWEWMFHDAFGAKLPIKSPRWIEPPWKAILSNKGVLPLLWEMFPRHENLLPAYFEDDPKVAQLDGTYVRKPLFSREGANVSLVKAGLIVGAEPGPYGEEGYIRQAMASLPNFSGRYAVIGSWIVDGQACGLSIREDENPITGNQSRFVPHAIL